MSESYEGMAMMPCNGNNIMRNLYVDLFNLIVESRMPGIDERGYGNGYHCPPLLGQNVHLCDLMKPECRKNQTMIHHLLQAVRHNVFEIEVLMLPECCSDSKLSERIQNKEYVLLERWSMTFLESDKAQFSIEIPDLLRAVRSFLHFSQISAWLSSTKGKSPANIFYWVKPTSDPSSTKFENIPEVHSFPLFKVNDDLHGTVKVNYPTRKQYIPIIPCSKHPPLQGLRLKLTEDSNLTPTISLNQQIVKHLQINCDNQQSIIAVKHCATDPDPLKTSSTAALKSVTHAVKDINKTNRILKHSNPRTAEKITFKALSNSCGAQISKRKEISSKSEATLLDNYGQTFTKCSSQENLCLHKSSLTTLLPKNVSKLNVINSMLLPSLNEKDSIPAKIAHQRTAKQNVPKCSYTSSNLLSPDTCNGASTVSSMLSTIESSQSNVSTITHDCNTFLGNQKNCLRKSLKRKQFLRNEESHIIPNKKTCLHKEKYEKESFPSKLLFLSCLNNAVKKSSRKKRPNLASSEKASYVVDSVQAENFKCDKLRVEESNDYNSSCKSASSGIECISSESKEKGKQYLENCSKQPWNNCFNIVPRNETNFNLANTSVKIKLVNLPEQTSCKNQILCENLESDNCFSSNCDNLISAKSDCDTSKKYGSGPISNTLKNLNSYNVKEISVQYCKNYINTNNETVLNVKNDFREGLKNTSKGIIGANISKNCLADKSIKNVCSQIQKSKINKRYINSFFKSCRLRKLELNKSSNQERTCSLSKKQDNILELIKSSATTSQQVYSCFNISPNSVINPFFIDWFCKKGNPKLRLQNRCKSGAKSSTLDFTQLETTEKMCIQNQIVTDSSTNPLFVGTQGSEIDISEQSLLKPSKSSLLDSSYYTCEPGHKKSFLKSSNIVHNFQDSKNKIATSSWLDASPNIERTSFFSCNSSCNVLPQKATPYLDCFPRHKLKFARGRKLLGNFEESILKGCLFPVSNVKGFRTEIGASGSFCPNHVTLPADVSFYEMDNLHSGSTPYMAHVTLDDIEYYVPRKGAVQVTLFNPSETVVKMFVLNYDLSDMPPSCHTFIRQKSYYLPVGYTEDCPSSSKWLRFILHLRFASSKTGKLYLHKDFKIVVLNKSNDDAASEFNQEPRELRSFLHVPKNPTFSNF